MPNRDIIIIRFTNTFNNKDRKKLMKKIFKILIPILIKVILICFVLIIIIFHSPFTTLKELWVTTAMSTLSHQYLARLFVSDAEIARIMSKNRVIQTSGEVDLSQVSTKVESALIEKIDISGAKYKGVMLIVHDPSRVFVGTADIANSKGKFIKDLVQKYNAVAGINAGGFIDAASKHGNGRGPDGLLISKGVVLQGYNGVKYNLIGFTEENKLMMGSFTLPEIKKLKIRDAVSFFPILIKNGEPSKMIGDGGWGLAPRTAIGQRQDGAVLLLAIDGRQIGSIGASMKDLQDIMIKYGAFNATNLDGGSSTIMYYEDKIVNKPCSVSTGRYLPDAFIVDQSK